MVSLKWDRVKLAAVFIDLCLEVFWIYHCKRKKREDKGAKTESA